MKYSDYADGVNGQLAHRKKELTDLRLSSKLSDCSKMTRRAIFLIAYSHWEGFIRFLCTETLKYINGLNLKYCELYPAFSAIAIYQSLKSSIPETEFGQTQLLMKYICDDFSKDIEQPFCVGKTVKWVDTRANLKKEALENILALFGITKEDIQLYEFVSNGWVDSFVNKRNQIGHGGLDAVDDEEFDVAVDRVISLLDAFSATFLDYVQEKKYLRIVK